MNGTLSTALLLVGAVLWCAAALIWCRPSSDHIVLKLVYLPVLVLLYASGYFCVLSAMGVDHWDDSSAWYWDTWLLFGSSAALAMAFAWVRFKGLLRVGLVVLPVLALLDVVWFYLTA